MTFIVFLAGGDGDVNGGVRGHLVTLIQSGMHLITCISGKFWLLTVQGCI